MSQHRPIPQNDMEEAAQGHDLFRAPGADLQIEQAEDQAVASGWLPPDTVYMWPSTETHRLIDERRQRLYDAMRRLETSVARASGQGDWAKTVKDALVNLSSALKAHVEEIEAPNGLFAEVIDMAPHLSSDVEQLRREHQDLVSSCRATFDLVSRTATAAEVRRKVLGLLGKLAIHRQRGAELLFDAYNVDLTAGD